MTALADRLTRALVPADQAPLAVLPARQAGWVAAQVAVGVGLWAAGLWATHPELSLSLALSAGPVAASPRRWWALPLVAAGVVGAGLATAALGAPAILGAGAVAGAAAALLLPDRTDWLDVLNASLASLAGAGLGLWAAMQLLPGAQGTLVAVLLISAMVGLVASQGLLPVAVRVDSQGLPSFAKINRTLRPPYRPPVTRALELFGRARPHAPDKSTRKGMAEVVMWVYRLQLTLQSHDDAIGTIDPVEVQERIDACDNDDVDAFTRERRQATAVHLRRLLDHHTALTRERARTEALVEYALAFLEEASAGLAVARELPGEHRPDRLPEVLHRLRDHAEAGDARRETARELEAIEA